MQAIPGADYLLVGDLDWNPCVTAAKESLLQRCSQAERPRDKRRGELAMLAGIRNEQLSQMVGEVRILVLGLFAARR